ncbi:MAG: hypothetical protein KAH32_01415, partial [Chlamydiia bacterium]|nr:hypothetical protein [Chlamydiia bacterium]
LGKDENTSKLEKEVAPEKFVEVILKDVVSPEPVLDKLGKLKQGCDILKSVKVKPRDAVKVGLDKDGVSSELKNKHIALLKKSYKNIKFPRDFLDTGYMPMINNVFTPVYKLIRASNTLDLGDLASKEIVFNDLVVGSNMRTSAKFTYILSSYGLFLERKSLLESFKPGTIPDLELTLASYNDQLEKADKSLNQFISSKKGLAEIGRSMEELSNKISNIPRVMYRKAAMLVMLYTIYENVLEDVLDSGRDDPSADKSYKGGDWEWSNIFSGCIKFNPSLGFMSNRSSGICGDALAEDIIDVPGSSLYVTDTLKDIETNFKKK